MTHVFVTADDFGLHKDLNRGIADGVRSGVIHGLSVSTNGSAVDWSLLRELKDAGASIGVHLTWVDEPWLTGGGPFRRGELFRRLLIPGSGFVKRVEVEAGAQVERLIEHGFTPTHLDSHQHVHVFPFLWEMTRRLRLQHGIARVRVPWVPRRTSMRWSGGGVALQFLSAWRRRETPQAWPCVGIAQSGHNTPEQLVQELHGLKCECVEVVGHPGHATPDLSGRYRHWDYDWNAERRLLEAECWRGVLIRSGCDAACPRASTN